MLSWFRRRALDEPAAREAARARAEQRLLGHAWPRALLDVVSSNKKGTCLIEQVRTGKK